MGVLDDMTKGITQRKADKAGPNLTPVGVEASSVKPSLPNDVGVFMSNESLLDTAVALREKALLLNDIADGLDRLVKGEPAIVADPVVEQKLAEKEADRQAADRAAAEAGDKKAAERVEFAENFKRQQAEAQAAVFTGSDAPAKVQAAPEPSPAGWTCPEHGDEDIEELTSRLRPDGYLACSVAGCGEYEPKG